MLIDNQAGLAGEFGAEDSRIVAFAYETAISIVSPGDATMMPGRSTRRAMVNAMLGDARRNGFNRDRLTLVALAAAAGGEATASAG